MKKLVLIGTIMASLVGVSAFGQGYFNFTGGKSSVWDGFSGASSTRDTLINVAFLWAANGDTAAVSSILASTSNNVTTATSSYSAAAAWTAILTDPNFTVALDVNNGNAPGVITSTATGGWIYKTGAANQIGVLNTVAGNTYSLYVIGYANGGNTALTPAQAAAAGASVGWSAVQSWQFNASTATLNTLSAFQIGVAGTLGPVPEPTTLALAGLGGLGLLLFRRRQ